MITQGYIEFFKELEINNNTEWFHANKKRYEQHVKIPFTNLVQDLIPRLQHIEPEMPDTTKEVMMRINKDIRFSKDKTPYNLAMKANFTPGGRKSPNPGFYLGISSDALHVGGGIYHTSPADLKKIRNYMINHTEEASDLMQSKTIIETFGGIKGEQSKRIDKEFQAHVEDMPFILNKQFFYMSQHPISMALDENLINVLVDYFKIASSVHKFLKSAVNS
ncbi:MAG: DUF2461 domain-containing protein [Cyclobacteriaceae bacterium]